MESRERTERTMVVRIVFNAGCRIQDLCKKFVQNNGNHLTMHCTRTVCPG